MSDVQKVLEQLTAVDAAIAAGRYGLQGEYRIAATLLQLAGALQAREPQPAPAPLTYDTAYAPAGEPLQAAPSAAPQLAATAAGFFRQAGRGRRRGRGLADTAVIPLPVHESHAPTECVFQIGGRPCAELIRWSEVNGWYHVQDRQLGAASHRATPGPTVGG